MSEINWGKYALIDEVEYRFEQEPNWWWKIKPVTSGMELAYSKFLNHHRVKRNPDGTIEEFPPVWGEIAHRQIALCFAGTNIPMGEAQEGEDGFKPIIKENASLSQIEAKLTVMPSEMIEEIWKAVGEAIPQWGPIIIDEDDPKDEESD